MHFSRFFQIIYFQVILTIGAYIVAYGSCGKKVFANDVVYLALPIFLVLLPFEQLYSKRQLCTLDIVSV